MCRLTAVEDLIHGSEWFDRSIPSEHARRDAGDRRSGCDGLEHDRPRADARVGADLDVAEYGGARADQDAMSHLRVAVARLFSCSTERDVLEDRHIVLNDAGLSDHDAYCVVEKDPRAQARGRMYVDLERARCASLEMEREFATVGLPEGVREAMGLNRQKALCMKKDVERLRRRGIALEHGRDVRASGGKDRGILGHEQMQDALQRRRCEGCCKKACDEAADGVPETGSRGDAVGDPWCQDGLAAPRLFGFGEDARPKFAIVGVRIHHDGNV